MTFVPKVINNIAKSFKCGCSQFKFGTNPPVTMMARIMREGEEKIEMATYKKEENRFSHYFGRRL